MKKNTVLCKESLPQSYAISIIIIVFEGLSLFLLQEHPV